MGKIFTAVPARTWDARRGDPVEEVLTLEAASLRCWAAMPMLTGGTVPPTTPEQWRTALTLLVAAYDSGEATALEGAADEVATAHIRTALIAAEYAAPSDADSKTVTLTEQGVAMLRKQLAYLTSLWTNTDRRWASGSPSL